MVGDVLDMEGGTGIVLTCWIWKEVLELCRPYEMRDDLQWELEDL